MDAPELIFTLSEGGETVVRTYKCTTLQRWFVPPSNGYLTITNKRVVFHSSGKSLSGKSMLINEMPLEDVAGVNAYQGLSVNWLLFILFTAFAYFSTQTLVLLLPEFFVSYWMVFILSLPFGLISLLKSNLLNEQIKTQIFESLDNIFKGTFRVNRDLNNYLPYVRIPFYLGLSILGWRLAFSSNVGSGASFIPWLLLLVIYGYIFFNWVGRRVSFSLQIGSKTMKDSGIYIPGDSFQLLPGRGSTALQGLGGSPAEDAGKVIRELGALLMDMQQLGEHAIEKWKTAK